MTDFLIILAFGFMLFFATITDAIKDSIDHKKGAETLYGFWHLTKHLLRIELFATGYLFCLIILSIESMFYKGLFTGSIITVLFMLKDIIWYPFYKSILWKQLDNTWIIKTGWKWLDKKLGFDKQP